MPDEHPRSARDKTHELGRGLWEVASFLLTAAYAVGCFVIGRWPERRRRQVPPSPRDAQAPEVIELQD